jgi:hypothetical protein
MYGKASAADAAPAALMNFRRPDDCFGMTTSSSEGLRNGRVVAKEGRVYTVELWK